MKIAVTGHTSGIGKAIYDYFAPDNSVIGFSRGNGYDINNPDDRARILQQSLDSDIFVNNASLGDSQLAILKLVFSAWENTDKLIINISSRYTTDPESIYCIRKKELDNFCEQNTFNRPLIINLKPGLTDTPRVLDKPGQKMSTDRIIEILDYALKSRSVLKIHSITFGL